MGSVEGRHVVVTGAGTGIGRAIAIRLAAEGAQLSLLARDAARLAVVGEELGAFHRSCEIRDDAQVDAAFAAADERNGPIHALVAKVIPSRRTSSVPIDASELRSDTWRALRRCVTWS